jgi:hypothetical protein
LLGGVLVVGFGSSQPSKAVPPKELEYVEPIEDDTPEEKQGGYLAVPSKCGSEEELDVGCTR